MLNFLEVCEEKSFTKASKRRYITQQGISKSIKELEEELGVPLFFRTRQGIVLTEFGSVLKKAAHSYVNQHNYTLDIIKQLKEKTRTYISIGLLVGINDALPLHFFKKFLDFHPDISLNIMSFTDDECQAAIIEHKLQMGIAREPIDTNHFVSKVSTKNKLALLVGKNHRLARCSSIKMKELKDEEVIVLNSNRYLLDMCERNDVRSIIHLKLSETSLIYDLCSPSRIVTFWSSSIYRFPGLVHVPIEDMDMYRGTHLIVNKHAYISDAAEKFIAYAEKEISLDQDLRL